MASILAASLSMISRDIANSSRDAPSNSCACIRIAATGLRTSWARLVVIRPSKAKRSAERRRSRSVFKVSCVVVSALANCPISSPRSTGTPGSGLSPPIIGNALARVRSGRVTRLANQIPNAAESSQKTSIASQVSGRFRATILSGAARKKNTRESLRYW